MKGITKAFQRTPHMITSKVGMSKKSVDPEFEDYGRNVASLESATEKLIKNSKAFSDGVIALFTSGAGFATHFSAIFHPIAGEYDLIGKNPGAAATVRNVDAYQSLFEDLRAAIAPELELIESRIIAPVKEYQGVLKTIRKTMTKREHKLVDYDRFNNSLTKLRDKKEKSLNDEKNLFKLEQDFEVASNEYDYINTALKTDLPRFLTLSTQFIDPLFHSFFYMQLNIYYMMLEKLQSFSEGKYDVSTPPGQITADYEEKRTDAWQQIESLGITKRIISTSKMVQQQRAALGTGGHSYNSGLQRSSSSATSPSFASREPPSRSASTASSFKKPPPPPPGAAARSPKPADPFPPPYSLAGSASSAAAAAAKRAPPPPPLKPKPLSTPQPQMVVALYDFTAQADGDLSFRAGDRIEVVERTTSAEDWWTGRLNGVQGVFPGNYVQDT